MNEYTQVHEDGLRPASLDHLGSLLVRARLHPQRRASGLARGAFKTALSWDPSEARRELERFCEADWSPLPEGEGWSRLALIEPDGRGGSREHPQLTHCPALRGAADRFGAKILALTLARLNPGGGVHEHRDLSGGLSMGVVRLHLPLITDPGVEFRVDGQRVVMLPGEIWQLDTTHAHAVHNHGQAARIHLIIDLEATPNLRDLLPPPEPGDWLHRAHFSWVCVSRGAELALRSPSALADRVERFVRLRVLGQAVLTFEDPAPSEPGRAHVHEPIVDVPPELACPECGGELDLRDDLTPLEAPWNTTHGLRCRACAREYPRVDGVWVLWSDALRALIRERPSADDPAATAKWANYTVYEQMSADYGEHADASDGYLEQIARLDALARSHARERARERVLVDVGCANGFALDRLRTRYARTIGVDLSLGSLREVARRGHVAVLGDAERLPLARGSVDQVTCFAALHHFPDPTAFARSSLAALRPGGVLLTGADPSRAAMHMGPLARAAWELRKPVYRALSRALPGMAERGFLHASRDRQDLNELAEHHRTGGGFDPDELAASLHAAGFVDVAVFFDVDRNDEQRLGWPSWQLALLKGLSGQHPLRRSNWAPLSSLARKP